MNWLRIASIAFLLLLSLLCRSQQGASPPTPSPVGESRRAASPSGNAPPAVALQTQANLVLVDIVVTRNNTAVRGLSLDSFRVFDNGKPVHVTVFETHDAQGSAHAGQSSPPPGPNIYSNVPDMPAGSAVDVLLIDALNTPASDQMYVREKMLRYLAAVSPGTPMAVFTLASRLRMVQGFTTDAALIARSISVKGSVQPSSLLDMSSGDPAMDPTADLAGAGASAGAISSLQQFEADIASFATDVRVRMTLDAMKQIARYLARVPGRKNLIWISGSFPLDINPDPALDNPFEAMRNYSDDVREADILLSAARVAVYPVDGRGLLMPPSANAANSFSSDAPSARSSGGGSGGRRGRRGGSGLPTNSSGLGTNLSAAAKADARFQRQSTEEHFTMEQIAEETGGEAFFNTNAIGDAVRDAMAHGSTYYTLGYVPEFKKDDGTYHRLKVVMDDGLHAVCRRGYFAGDLSTHKNPAEEAAKSLREALEPGSPPVSDLIFKVRVLAADDPAAAAIKPSPEPAGGMAKTLKPPPRRYIVDFAVGTHLLAMPLTADGVHYARLEFGMVAFDSDGRRLNYSDQSAEFRLTPDLYEKVMRDGVPSRQEIDLPPGQVFLRVMVHDLNNARLGVIEIPIRVSRK